VVQGLAEEIEHPEAAPAARAPVAAAPASVAPPAAAVAAPVIGDVREERESADQIFSLEDDTLVVEEEPESPTAAAAPADLGASEAQDAAYGPDSRIQDIQAAEAAVSP